ncbi:MAG: MFS transporter [Christensenellales bacterium]
MTQAKAKLLRIEGNYAGVQASYWVAILSLSGFMTVYLSFKGFNDTQIGLTASIISILTIGFQLFISNYSDAHLHIPLKRIIAGLYLLALVMGTVVWQLPPVIPLVMLCYALACAFENTINGLLNAQIMQYVNAGIPVKYGWPRGIGSIVYAGFALLLGILIEQYSPAILMPMFLGVSLIAILLVLLMPEVSKLSGQRAAVFVQEQHQERTSYRQMLRDNAVFRRFLVASVVLYIGVSPSMLFLVRVIQSAGGGSSQLGIAMSLQAGMEMPMMFLSPWVMRRAKPENLLGFSFLIYLVKALILTVAGSMTVIYVAMLLSVFCFGLYGFASVFFVNKLVKPGEKVRAQGLVSLCGSLGGIVASLFSGVLMDTVGLQALLILSAVIMLLAFLLMLSCRQMIVKNAV